MGKAAGFTIFLSLLLACASPAARAMDSLEVDGALVWIGNAAADAAPSPLLPALGMNFPVIVRRYWGLDIGFLVTGAYYGYVDERAIPMEMEYASLFGTLAILGDARVAAFLPIGERVRLGLSAGLLLALRVPFPLDPAASEDFGSAFGYLLERAVYPETGLSVRFPILPAFDLEARVRAAWPWFHLWDGEPYPFWDQLAVIGELGGIYRFPARSAE
jgi:hypothetical protein